MFRPAGLTLRPSLRNTVSETGTRAEARDYILGLSFASIMQETGEKSSAKQRNMPARDHR